MFTRAPDRWQKSKLIWRGQTFCACIISGVTQICGYLWRGRRDYPLGEFRRNVLEERNQSSTDAAPVKITLLYGLPWFVVLSGQWKDNISAAATRVTDLLERLAS